MTRYLALDPGDKTVGCALSDREGIVARPLPPLARRPHARFLREVAALVLSQEAEALVVGVPLFRGRKGPRAQAALALAHELRKTVRVPVFTQDESYTTAEAREIMDANGTRSERARAARVDGIAAALILERRLGRAGKRAAPAGSLPDGPPPAGGEPAGGATDGGGMAARAPGSAGCGGDGDAG
ncbi:MAG: Holliday junction resolvase RuvX [Deltaproteobacteria bacterium]|jgi:putative Holliday junction resolvase|nr:Holliday junction resolvase RuvX [Deltaproteobacteria bacterium]